MGAWGTARGAQLGRYALYDRIAAGGMASIHLGRLKSELGFTRTVAIKRLHPQFAADREFVAMFLDEARLAARVRHANVVPILDVQAAEGELFLVMDYITGESLSQLFAALHGRGERVPHEILSAILSGALYGLHAAHEATSDSGAPLGIVHRDVSPHNIIVGTDGSARVADFGIAKAAGRLQETASGDVKGKLLYMAPEQLACKEVDRRTDVYSAAVVAWEGLTGRRIFGGDQNPPQLARLVAEGKIDPPSVLARDVPPPLDAIVMKALSTDPALRYPTAAAFAEAIEAVLPPASPRRVGEWVGCVAQNALRARAEALEEIERSSRSGESSLPEVLDAIRSSSSGVSPARDVPHSSPGSARLEDGEHSRSKVNVTLSNPPVEGGGRNRTVFGAALLGGGLVVMAAVYSLRLASPSSSVAPPDGTDSLPAWPQQSLGPPLIPEPPRPDDAGDPRAKAPRSATSGSSNAPVPTNPPRPARRPPTPPTPPAPTHPPVAVAPPDARTEVDASAAPKPDPCANPYYLEGGIKKIRAECIH